ncbi:winged helix-turn-helix transcriptional regulator [Bacillus solitudinis]|uniref:winged helix-turn-helix transcriptional regulator n=1 Tax=Bacillus solitudinis TaxID=2014074 RepID=UPI000C23CF00|nr:helix-turn-helix domain-containing protein [Bacillus solitudinis]
MEHGMLCPKVESAFTLLGKKWTGLIIFALINDAKRFRDISSLIPNMSDRILTERIKELEDAEIIVRHVYPEKPVRIEYKLTEKGKKLKAVIDEVQKWAEDYE